MQCNHSELNITTHNDKCLRTFKKFSHTYTFTLSLTHTHKHMLQTLVFSSSCMLLAAHFGRKLLIIHMTEGLHWLYRGTPRMDFTPMTSKKYVSVTGWRIWEGLVCVCVCVFLFIHSVIYTVQSSELFSASPCFFLPSSYIQNIQGTDTRDANHINASHFLPCCTFHKHWFSSIYEWTALYTTDSVLLNTKLPQGFELLVNITFCVGISRYMLLSAPWFLWILIFVLLTNEGVDNRRNEGKIPRSAAL